MNNIETTRGDIEAEASIHLVKVGPLGDYGN